MSMNRKFRQPLLIAIAIILTSSAMAADLSSAITYQGQLNQSGSPLNATADFEFTLWDAATDGAAIGSKVTSSNITVVDGLFTVSIDFGVAAFDGDARWLEISVRSPAGSGSYTKLTPRQVLTATPYALQTRGLFVDESKRVGIGTTTPIAGLSFADTLGNKIALYGQGANHFGFGIQSKVLQIYTVNSGADVALGYGSSDSFTETMRARGNGRVGIGTATPDSALEVVGNSAFPHLKVSSQNNSTTPFGAFLSLDATANTGGKNFLIYSTGNDANEGRGKLVFQNYTDSNVAMAINSAGFVGIGTTDPGARLHTIASEDGASAILGEGDGSGGVGVEGNTNAENGIGVLGSASSATGFSFGVTGTSSSRDGTGVSGEATRATGSNTGVYGYAHGDDGVGVWGVADGADGIAVHGQVKGGANYGVYSTGNIGASGTKSFVIDHPQDPENKTLRHYCEEGPEPMNSYSGVVTLDAAGEAEVILPAYFESINRDFRYQLTCLRQFAPVFVKDEIVGGRFVIAGGKPGMRVSWEVKGVRNDRFVQTHGAPVEQEKSESVRGTYLQPELYGLPASFGQFYRAPREVVAPKSQSE